MYSVPIGDLIEQLCISHIKMWHLDEAMSKAAEAGDKEKAGELAILARQQNAHRTKLREEVNERLDGIRTGSDKIEYTIGRADAKGRD